MAHTVLPTRILDSVPILVRTLNGQISQWSSGMQRLYSYSADQALGKIAHVLLKTSFPKPLAEIEQEVRDTGRWKGELEETRATGEPIVVMSEWSLFKNARSGSEQIVVFNADITSQSRDLADLQFLASIVEGSLDAIISKDPSGIITSWNHAAEKMFGYRADEIIGKPILTLFPPDRLKEEQDILERLAAGKRIQHYETTRLHRDGHEFDVSLTLSPIKDRSGNIIGASKIVRDISERRQLQKRLEEVQTELLHVSRLNDMSQMATGLAHELNQPLSAAASYLAGTRKLIQSGELDRALEGCTKASSQLLRAGDVIRRLRDFMSNNVSERRLEPLRPLFEEAAHLVLAGSPSRTIEIEYDVPPEADAALVDRVQVQQVVVNFVRNAIEAMTNSPERRLTVRTRRTENEFVQVEVSDTGPGIPEDVLPRLFSPFMTTKPNGMGVGLALCRTIVEAHGGTISVENNRGTGATFRFTLPRN